MSVSESEKECPLCMEALDWDDLGFYPCSCGYQICRFCWHRLRTDENGLCPACRQAFPDIPVSFNPEISAEELKKQKRRNKERKSNKDPVFKPQDLATLRVVQKNLVFVIGLSSRLTQEDLKKEFAHFGKIIKFVHNKSTAYITYSKPEEAIRAIRTLNASAAQESAAQQLQLINVTSTTTTTTTTNLAAATVQTNNNIITLNGTNSFTNPVSVPTPTNRLKASLGTTKYCNHFLRSQQCPKVGECMYLHEIAEAEASFTKEQMQAGKHVEYEKKLMDSYVASLSQPPSLQLMQLQQQQQQLQQQQLLSQPQAPPPSQAPSQVPTQASQLQQPLQQQPSQITQHAALLRQQIAQFQTTQNQQQQQQQQTQSQLQLLQQQQQQQQSALQALLQNHNQSQPSPPSSVPQLSPSPPQQQQQQRQMQQQKEQQQLLQQQQQQQQLSNETETDSEDDGLDFDPISVSTDGLRDLLDQQLQMQNYLQQMSANQSLASVLFQQNGRLNHQVAPTTNRLIVDAAFNGHSVPTLASLAGLTTNNSPPSQQEQVAWPNLSTWTNFLQRSGYGFENGS